MADRDFEYRHDEEDDGDEDVDESVSLASRIVMLGLFLTLDRNSKHKKMPFCSPLT